MRQVLKHHTAPIHRALDDLPALSSLLRPGLSLSQYAETIDAFAWVYESLEGAHRRLELTSGLGLVPPYTPRLTALIHDLDELHRWCLIPRRAPALDQERCRMRTKWHYWGWRYVLEGATQGSKIIAARLRRNLPQLAPRAFEFWELQLRMSREWPIICSHLAQEAPQGDAARQLLEGADMVFSTFRNRFEML